MGTIMIGQIMGVMLDHDRVINHDCVLGLLEHDHAGLEQPIANRVKHIEYRPAVVEKGIASRVLSRRP